MDYLHLAEKIAKGSMVSSSDKHFIFGCVALRQDGAIVTSTNLPTKDRHASAHAEHRVLKKAGQGAIIWVTRIDRAGNWAMAKPCTSCEAYLKNKRVKRVYYSIGPSEYGVLKF